MNKLIAYQEKARADAAFKQLRDIKKRIGGILDGIETREPKYTGWFILLKKNDESISGFEFLGFFDPYKDIPEPEWDMCIPIKSLEILNEFQGW